jgi:uncharacterized protein YvpB
MIDAPFIDQREKYPTGCESVTAVMALNHAGVEITPDEFIDTYLEKGSVPCGNGGAIVGANPRNAFVGNPYSPNDYGCYAPVIKKAIEKILCGNENTGVASSTEAGASASHAVSDVSGIPLEQLCAMYIREGIPVILWATMYMRHTYRGDTWRDETDASTSIRWRNNEHCLLLVGYDKDHYYFNDPLLGAKTRFTKSATKRAYKSMFKQALVIE